VIRLEGAGMTEADAATLALAAALLADGLEPAPAEHAVTSAAEIARATNEVLRTFTICLPKPLLVETPFGAYTTLGV
jgi:hypothetical protein